MPGSSGIPQELAGGGSSRAAGATLPATSASNSRSVHVAASYLHKYGTYNQIRLHETFLLHRAFFSTETCKETCCRCFFPQDEFSRLLIFDIIWSGITLVNIWSG